MVNAPNFQENCKTNLYLLENIIVQTVTNVSYDSKNFMFAGAVFHLSRGVNFISGACITYFGEL